MITAKCGDDNRGRFTTLGVMHLMTFFGGGGGKIASPSPGCR